MDDFEIGVTRTSEEDFSYILYGVSAAEIAALLDVVCKPENRKHRNVGAIYVNTKYVGNLLGTEITVLVRGSAFEGGFDRAMERRLKSAGMGSAFQPSETTPIREYQITTDEWDISVEVHHGRTDGTHDTKRPRGIGMIEGRKSTVSKPYFDGDVDTYLSQMSILRLMIPMLMEDAA